MTVEPTLDPGGIDRLLEITGGDVAFVDELIDTYIEDGGVQIEALRQAAAGGAIADLVRPAHSLKSSSDGVGAVALTSLCRALEAESRGGGVTDSIERVAAIAETFEATRVALLAARRTP
jgi:HPt (histidine-containing phosphotransfer) domain-containing protein